MADTQRTLTALMTLLADNTAGAISPQDVRDLVATVRARAAQISVPLAAAAAITISDTTSYFECTAPTWSLGPADSFDQSDGNGRLTYIGTVAVMLHLACTVSFSSASNNQQLHLRLAKNGTTDATSEVVRKVGTGADVGSAALHLIVSVAANDHISLWVRNATSAANITIQAANLQAVTMPE
jgi:hypothetical protein